ncbi:MAG: hypothetical protein ACXWLP_11730 [Myxococcaceae bacterium]
MLFRLSPRVRSPVLRTAGVLLLALGLLHLAVTPFIVRMLQDGAAPGAAGWLTPPMVLNHVVVGILLLPIGGLVAYAAPDAAGGARWALVLTRSIAVAIAALPPTLFQVMGTRYFQAVPFRIAAIIVCLASVVLLLAAFWPGTPSPESSPTSAIGRRG